jgi:hypothetical protein
MTARLLTSSLALVCAFVVFVGAGSAMAASPALRSATHASGPGELTVVVRDSARTDRVALYIDGHLIEHLVTHSGLTTTVHRLVRRGSTLRIVAVGRLSQPRISATMHRTRRTRRTRPGTAANSEAADPSGEAMPVGNLPGWRQVFSDDFTGSSLDSCWGAYSGVIPSSPTSVWAPSHISVFDGIAQLSTYQDPAFGGQWTAAGMSSAPCLSQEYGKYEVRFRMDKAPGVKYAILLWPSTQPWPCGGEIDFGEDAGGDRSTTMLTDNYCDSNGQHAILPESWIHADFSQWHTIGVEWTHDKIVWTMDGKTEATINNAEVPADKMELDIQAEANTNCSLPFYSCISPSTPSDVHLDVDWVTAYAPAA